MKSKNAIKILDRCSVTVLWLVSFVSVIALCIIVTVVTYCNMERKMYEIINDYSKDIIESKVSIIDEYIDGIIEDLLNVSSKSEIAEFAGYEAELTDMQKFKMGEFGDEILKIYDNNYDGETFALVYFPKSGKVIGRSVVRDVKRFFESNGWKGDCDEWIDNVLLDVSNGFYNDSENNMFFIRVHPSAAKTGIEPVLVAGINNESLNEKIGNILHGDFVIYDDEQIISSSGKDYSEIIEKLDFEHQMKNDEIGEYVVSYINAAKYGWKYIYLVDSDDYIGVLRHNRNLMIFSVFLCILGGGLLSLYFSKRNNQSLFDLSKRFEIEQTGKSKNEYEIIEKNVLNMMKQSEKKEQLLYMQKQKLQNEFLLRLLHGKVYWEEVKGEMYSLKIDFEYENFIITMIRIDEYENIFFEENKDLSMALSLGKFVISNIYKDFLKNEYHAFCVEEDNTLIFVINMEDNDDNAKNRIIEIFEEGKKLILDTFNIESTVLVSAMQGELQGLPVAYRELCHISTYGTVYDKNGIIDAEEFISEYESLYYYPLEYEQIVINNVTAGNTEKANEAIRGVLDLNMKQHLSPVFMKCLMINILCTLIKVADIDGEGEKYNTYNILYESIVNNKSVNEIEEKIFMLVDDICKDADIKRNIIKDKFVTEIKEYIELNYSNQLLNVNMLAEKAGTSAGHVSAKFKKCEGIGLLEYITRRRVAAAKQMIENTDESLDEIAQLSGFTSRRTFFRAFMKYEGVTPGKFRKM